MHRPSSSQPPLSQCLEQLSRRFSTHSNCHMKLGRHLHQVQNSASAQEIHVHLHHLIQCSSCRHPDWRTSSSSRTTKAHVALMSDCCLECLRLCTGAAAFHQCSDVQACDAFSESSFAFLPSLRLVPAHFISLSRSLCPSHSRNRQDCHAACLRLL